MFFNKENRELKVQIKNLRDQLEDLEDAYCYTQQNMSILREQVNDLKRPLSEEVLNTIVSKDAEEIADAYVRPFNSVKLRNEAIKSILAKRIIRLTDPK